jgi:arylsulfatase A
VAELADFTDLYPTFCEFAGVALDPGHAPDGKSFAGVLRDAKEPPHRKWILNEYHTMRVVRNARFKLYSDGRMYDADADPGEEKDLAGDGRAEVAAARAELEGVLAGLPGDVPPPFPLRSQSGFKIRTAERAAGK